MFALATRAGGWGIRERAFAKVGVFGILGFACVIME